MLTYEGASPGALSINTVAAAISGARLGRGPVEAILSIPASGRALVEAHGIYRAFRADPVKFIDRPVYLSARYLSAHLFMGALIYQRAIYLRAYLSARLSIGTLSVGHFIYRRVYLSARYLSPPYLSAHYLSAHHIYRCDFLSAHYLSAPLSIGAPICWRAGGCFWLADTSSWRMFPAGRCSQLADVPSWRMFPAGGCCRIADDGGCVLDRWFLGNCTNIKINTPADR